MIMNIAAWLLSLIKSRLGIDCIDYLLLDLLFLVWILFMTPSTIGMPAKVTQGTNETVNRNVRWYNGNADKGSPNK
jgi:hypothetical protein